MLCPTSVVRFFASAMISLLECMAIGVSHFEDVRLHLQCKIQGTAYCT